MIGSELTPASRPSEPTAPAIDASSAAGGSARGGRRAFIAMAAVASVAATAVTIVALHAQHGTFTYALDDAVIHLDLARNLAHHATFGMVPGTYESASSGPVWELLLAPLLLLTGDAWWTPLLLNVLAAGWVLWSFSRLPVVRRLAADRVGLVAVAAIPIGIGLVPLVFAGMEHTLHLAITLEVLLLLQARLRTQATARAYVPLWVLLAVGSLVRFETVFLAVGCAVALIVTADGMRLRPRTELAALTVAAAAAPVVAFALVNRSFGQYLLPNSIVGKTALGRTGLPIATPSEYLDKLTSDPVLLILLLVGALVLVIRRRGATVSDAVAVAPLVAVIATTLAHVALADVGWFERYQAYLIGGLVYGGLAAIRPPATADHLRRVALVLGALCLLRVPLLVNTPLATYNVYESEYQLGRFLAGYADGQGVGVNDIGYVGWFHQGDLVDFVGLGSIDMLRARKDATMGPAFTAAQMQQHGVTVVAVHDEFFKAVVPAGWDPAGTWCLTNRRLALASACVTFYAPAGSEVQRLRTALDAFEPTLPPEVAATRG